MAEAPHWLAVVGTREVDDEIRTDIEVYIRGAIADGWGIISGGATGVDHEAAQLAYEAGLAIDRFRIYLPAALGVYCTALLLRAEQGKCRLQDAEKTIALLRRIARERPGVINDVTPYKTVDAESFHARNRQIVALAHQLVAFRVNYSAGTTFTINQASARGVATRVFEYVR